MTTSTGELTQRERELGAIITAYNEVTEQLKRSHEQLQDEVRRLHEELAAKNCQLRRRERLAALGELAAGVAHEIRNPLGGIQVFASLLKQDLADRPDELGLLEKITRGVTTLESIVADILEFGRPAEPHPGPVRLDNLVRETVELAAPTIEQCGATIEISDKLAGMELETDALLLQRALLNLLFNAAEAAAANAGSTARPEVRVGSADGCDDSVTLTVSDNGSGIPSELMDRIFDPFFTTKDAGTGLGLAIVHQIVESLGGNVQAANRSKTGAVFSLWLPRRPNVE